MRYLKWAGIAAAILLVIVCFIPWIYISYKDITVTGVDATGTNYGKPGFFNLLMVAFFLFFTLMPRVWAKRANLLIVSLNLGWAVRNYFILSGCQMGECPDKKIGIYLVLFSSVVMLASALFPDMKLRTQKTQ